MVKIIFTRHGQTKWNLEKRCQGQTDIELTVKGLSQAKLLAQRLKKYDLDVVYTSDLKRAANTAKEIVVHRGSQDTELVIEPLLREYAFGSWEGLTVTEINQNYSELVKLRQVTPEVDIPDGEKYHRLVERGKTFVENCSKNHDGQTVLAVTHSGFIKALLHHYLELPWTIVKNNLYLDNCSLTVFKITPEKVILEGLNDTAHFENEWEMVEARH